MKASILILAILTNLIIIQPAEQARLLYTNQFECMKEILFNEELMKAILEMEESECEKDFDMQKLLTKMEELKKKKKIQVIKKGMAQKIMNMMEGQQSNHEVPVPGKVKETNELNSIFTSFTLDQDALKDQVTYTQINKQIEFIEEEDDEDSDMEDLMNINFGKMNSNYEIKKIELPSLNIQKIQGNEIKIKEEEKRLIQNIEQIQQVQESSEDLDDLFDIKFEKSKPMQNINHVDLPQIQTKKIEKNFQVDEISDDSQKSPLKKQTSIQQIEIQQPVEIKVQKEDSENTDDLFNISFEKVQKQKPIEKFDLPTIKNDKISNDVQIKNISQDLSEHSSGLKKNVHSTSSQQTPTKQITIEQTPIIIKESNSENTDDLFDINFDKLKKPETIKKIDLPEIQSELINNEVRVEDLSDESKSPIQKISENTSISTPKTPTKQITIEQTPVIIKESNSENTDDLFDINFDKLKKPETIKKIDLPEIQTQMINNEVRVEDLSDELKSPIQKTSENKSISTPTTKQITIEQTPVIVKESNSENTDDLFDINFDKLKKPETIKKIDLPEIQNQNITNEVQVADLSDELSSQKSITKNIEIEKIPKIKKQESSDNFDDLFDISFEKLNTDKKIKSVDLPILNTDILDQSVDVEDISDEEIPIIKQNSTSSTKNQQIKIDILKKSNSKSLSQQTPVNIPIQSSQSTSEIIQRTPVRIPEKDITIQTQEQKIQKISENSGNTDDLFDISFKKLNTDKKIDKIDLPTLNNDRFSRSVDVEDISDEDRPIIKQNSTSSTKNQQIKIDILKKSNSKSLSQQTPVNIPIQSSQSISEIIQRTPVRIPEKDITIQTQEQKIQKISENSGNTDDLFDISFKKLKNPSPIKKIDLPEIKNDSFSSKVQVEDLSYEKEKSSQNRPSKQSSVTKSEQMNINIVHPPNIQKSSSSESLDLSIKFDTIKPKSPTKKIDLPEIQNTIIEDNINIKQSESSESSKNSKIDFKDLKIQNKPNSEDLPKIIFNNEDSLSLKPNVNSEQEDDSLSQMISEQDSSEQLQLIIEDKSIETKQQPSKESSSKLIDSNFHHIDIDPIIKPVKSDKESTVSQVSTDLQTISIKSPSPLKKKKSQEKPLKSKSSIKQNSSTIEEHYIIPQQQSGESSSESEESDRSSIVKSIQSIKISNLDPKSFIEPSTTPLIIENYSQSSDSGYAGRTIYAIQTRIERIEHIQRHLATDSRSIEMIIEEIQILFKQLPICLQKALNHCKLNMKKVERRCNEYYKNSFDKICQQEDNLPNVTLMCQDNEDLFNGACYEKCPEGFEDAQIFCKKGKYIKRFFGPLDDKPLEKHELVWGGKYKSKDCKVYGPYYVNIGSDLCRLQCPEGWRDYGLLCEKPKRYLNQKIFVFSETDI